MMSQPVPTQSPEQQLQYDYEERAYYRYDEHYGDYMYLRQDGTPYKRVVRRPEAVEQQATAALQQHIRHRTDTDSAYQPVSPEQLSSRFGRLDLGTGSNYSHAAQSPYQYTSTQRDQDEERYDEDDHDDNDDNEEYEEGEEYEGNPEDQEEDADVDEAQIIPAGVIYEPKESVTDPELLQKGAKARGKIAGTKGKSERLDPSYRIQDQPEEFFIPGRVIKVLWPELAGYRVDNMTIVTAPNKRFKDEKVILKIRWFVVVKSGYKWCTCLPISTYGHRGLEGKDLPKKEHSIIYTGNKPPRELDGEKPRLRGERGMLSPIQVKPKSKQDIMDAKSRINYAKLYTIEHNVKVSPFGMVRTGDIRLLLKQWKDVLTDTIYVSEASPSYGGSSYASSSTSRTSPPASGYHYGTTGTQSDPPQYMYHAVASYDFVPGDDQRAGTQTPLQVGDRLGVITYNAQGWARVYNARTQQTGHVPANYIQLDSSPAYAGSSR